MADGGAHSEDEGQLSPPRPLLLRVREEREGVFVCVVSDMRKNVCGLKSCKYMGSTTTEQAFEMPEGEVGKL